MRILSLLLLYPLLLSAQPLTERYKDLGDLFVIQSTHAMFPHPAREAGHRYDDTLYTAAEHYRDSSVAVFVPKGFVAGDSTNVVVFFHGWRNTIDSTLAQFRLAQLFAACGRNAVLVLPEGPHRAPDSFGGKLEQPGVFRGLIADVFKALAARQVIRSQTVGSIVLAGHSGGCRVMGFILLHGGLTEHISEIIIFDGLYEQTEKFAHWIDHARGRYINIYTADGETKEECELLMTDLTGWGIPFRKVAEPALTAEDLRTARVLFIESDLTHNNVIGTREQFRRFLEVSGLPSR